MAPNEIKTVIPVPSSDIITVFAEDLPFFSPEQRALVRLLVSTDRATLKNTSEKPENPA
jgi:hypothetical protein